MAGRPPSWRHDKRRTAERGYGGKWQRERLQYLEAHPVCARCEPKDIVEPATVVNHKVPHRGNPKLFWDRKNWEPVCKGCHDGVIQSEEQSGIIKGTDRDGRPVDPDHPWNSDD